MTKQLTQNLETINHHLPALKEKYGVKRLAIFGSTARGEATKKSDIDIIVELTEPMGFFKFIRLENELSKILGKRVDLTTKKALKPAIKKEILTEAVYA